MFSLFRVILVISLVVSHHFPPKMNHNFANNLAKNIHIVHTNTSSKLLLRFFFSFSSLWRRRKHKLKLVRENFQPRADDDVVLRYTPPTIIKLILRTFILEFECLHEKWNVLVSLNGLEKRQKIDWNLISKWFMRLITSLVFLHDLNPFFFAFSFDVKTC